MNSSNMFDQEIAVRMQSIRDSEAIIEAEQEKIRQNRQMIEAAKIFKEKYCGKYDPDELPQDGELHKDERSQDVKEKKKSLLTVMGRGQLSEELASIVASTGMEMKHKEVAEILVNRKPELASFDKKVVERACSTSLSKLAKKGFIGVKNDGRNVYFALKKAVEIEDTEEEVKSNEENLVRDEEGFIDANSLFENLQEKIPEEVDSRA